MTCDRPGSVTPDELVAYLEGGAPPRVIEHLRTCAACATEADAYRRAQSRLGRTLHRFECPSPQILSEFELGFLAPDERNAIMAHLPDCPLCTRELRDLRRFLAEDPPHGVATGLGVVAGLRRVVATLVAPPARPAYAMRGSAEVGAQTYRAGNVTISIATGPAIRGYATLSGLVWSDDAESEEMAGHDVTLAAETGPAYAMRLDNLGNFAFEEIRPGVYRLEIRLSDQLVVVENVWIGG